MSNFNYFSSDINNQEISSFFNSGAIFFRKTSLEDSFLTKSIYQTSHPQLELKRNAMSNIETSKVSKSSDILTTFPSKPIAHNNPIEKPVQVSSDSLSEINETKKINASEEKMETENVKKEIEDIEETPKSKGKGGKANNKTKQVNQKEDTATPKKISMEIKEIVEDKDEEESEEEKEKEQDKEGSNSSQTEMEDEDKNERRVYTKRAVDKVKRWTKEEAKMYEKFIAEHEDIMSDSSSKRNAKIFLVMSNSIGTKTPSQCRSHHQKFYKKVIAALNENKNLEKKRENELLLEKKSSKKKNSQPKKKSLEKKSKSMNINTSNALSTTMTSTDSQSTKFNNIEYSNISQNHQIKTNENLFEQNILEIHDEPQFVMNPSIFNFNKPENLIDNDEFFKKNISQKFNYWNNENIFTN